MHDCKTIQYNHTHLEYKLRANKNVCVMLTSNTNPHNMHIILYSLLSRELDSLVCKPFKEKWIVLILFSVLEICNIVFPT